MFQFPFKTLLLTLALLVNALRCSMVIGALVECVLLMCEGELGAVEGLMARAKDFPFVLLGKSIDLWLAA